MYSDLERDPVTHRSVMNTKKLQEARRAYYSTLSIVDEEFGKLIQGMEERGALENTIVVFMADHGQSVGENDLWSMMSLMETATRVPFMIRLPNSSASFRTCDAPIELVDLYPTLVSLSGLNLTSKLPGKDISSCPQGGNAISQITRCKNCKLAYWKDPSSCDPDQSADGNYTVPCVLTPTPFFHYMGSSIRTRDWRASTYCKWNGLEEATDFSRCVETELYNHTADTGLYDIEHYENDNLATSANAHITTQLVMQLEAKINSQQ